MNVEISLEDFLAALTGEDYAPPHIGAPAPEANEAKVGDLADAAPFAPGTGQDVLDRRPADEVEAKRREHIGDFVLTMFDSTASTEVRTAALRHILACDPMRGLAMMAHLAADALDAVDMSNRTARGTSVRVLRAKSDEEASAAVDQGRAEFAKFVGSLAGSFGGGTDGGSDDR